MKRAQLISAYAEAWNIYFNRDYLENYLQIRSFSENSFHIEAFEKTLEPLMSEMLCLHQIFTNCI